METEILPDRIVLKAVQIDKDGNTLSEAIISDKTVEIPTDASDFGYNKQEQLDILNKMQQPFLEAQAAKKNKPPKSCPRCYSRVWKSGKQSSNFTHVFSNHLISLQAWSCSSASCNWRLAPTVKGLLSGKVHVDLLKLQVELGSRHSYREAEKELKTLLGTDRPCLNRMRIHRTTNQAGKILEQSKNKGVFEEVPPVESLHVTVDGGYVHDANHPHHNFEVMVGKVYRPEHVIHVDKHHTKITKKQCASSSKDDGQETMKQNLIISAKKAGVDKERTQITALADGAKNCWHVIEALVPLCLSIIFILDWFHIGKYIHNIKRSIPAFEEAFHEVRSALWQGHVLGALLLLENLSEIAIDTEHIRLINNFHSYIKINENRIVNYAERKEKGLVYSSHVAESTVEHLLNKRARKKQKMQWSRPGLHAVMEIRCSQVSGNWERDWEKVIEPQFKMAA